MRFSNEEREPLAAGEKDSDSETIYSRHFNHRWQRRAINLPLLISLGLSIIFNVLLVLYPRQQAINEADSSSASKFAKLVFDTPAEFRHRTKYDSEDEDATNKAWDDLSYDLGSVALPYDYAADLGLPRAQPYPWEEENKGLYFLNAYHSIHCLKIIRTTLLEQRDNRLLSFPLTHSMHCMEALLQDVVCFADDTPRFTSVAHPGRPGDGQPRTCRDWKKLEAYAKQHWSCWRDIKPTENIDTLLRYRYCPADSPYYERIHGIYGDFEEGNGTA